MSISQKYTVSQRVGLVFVSLVLRLEKDCNWTRLNRKKDRTAVLVFGI